MNPPSSTGGASKRHLVLPYAFDTNDIQFFHTNRFLRRRRFCIDVIEAFGWPHREGEHAPKIMSIGFDLWIIGRPGCTAALHKILAHVVDRGNAWIARRI